MDLSLLRFTSYLVLTISVSSCTIATSIIIDARSQGVTRGGSHNSIGFANFKAHKFSYLNISSLVTTHVLNHSECGIACVNMPSCLSFNLAVVFDITGTILCELLSSDKYNNSDKFLASQTFHHFSIRSPCSSGPCQNNGTCRPFYWNDSYSCLFTKNYAGKTCETSVPMAESTILGSVDKKYGDQLMTYLQPVLENANSTFVMCWSGKRDGWLAQTFHSNCDGKGPTVTLIKVVDYIFGGYTNEDWAGVSCGYKPASKAFLFSLYNVNGYDPIKLAQNAGMEGKAIYTCSTYGPTFGDGNDIHISDDVGNTHHSYTGCGHGYEAPEGYSVAEQVAAGRQCDFFVGSFQFTPDEVEVLYVSG